MTLPKMDQKCLHLSWILHIKLELKTVFSQKPTSNQTQSMKPGTHVSYRQWRVKYLVINREFTVNIREGTHEQAVNKLQLNNSNK